MKRPQRDGLLLLTLSAALASCFFRLDDVQTSRSDAGSAPDAGTPDAGARPDVAASGSPCPPSGLPINAACTCNGTCTLQCTETCNVQCASGSVCDVDCPSTGCDMACADNATCKFACTGGGCTFHCPPNSVTCTTSCAGNGCRSVWP